MSHAKLNLEQYFVPYTYSTLQSTYSENQSNHMEFY